MSGNPAKWLMISFLVGFGMSLLMIFFVWTRTLYLWIDVLLITLIGEAIMICVFMLIWQFQIGGYPIKVKIYEKRASHLFVAEDRAKRIGSREAGKFAYLLQKKKVMTKPINFDYLYIGNKGQAFLDLYMPQNNEFLPIKVSEAGDFQITSENAKYWYSEQLRRNYERWSKRFGWEKYAVIIQLATVGLVIGILLYIFLGQMQGVIAQIGGISTAQAELIKQVTTLVETLTKLLPPNAINTLPK